MNPELKNKKKFKVGDKVRVRNTNYHDHTVGIKEDEIYIVEAIAGIAIYINAPRKSLWPMSKNQLKLEENVKMQKFKIGEMVKVIELLTDSDRRNFKLNRIYKVMEVDHDGWPLIAGKTGAGEAFNYSMKPSQVELVDLTKSMSFPEITDMIIKGLIADGTELTMFDVDGDVETFFVIKGSYGYGITASRGCLVDNSLSFPSRMNGAWKITETAKEMTIEEVQKQLGHKIKIVEK